MAVDTGHLNLLPPSQLVHQTRDIASPNQGNILGAAAAYHNNKGLPLVPAMAESLLPPLRRESVQPKTSLNTDSGLTHNVTVSAAANRKRPRDSFDLLGNIASGNYYATTAQKNSSDVSCFPSLFGDNVLPCIQQYQMDIDAIISQHTKKIRIELVERQKQHTRILLSAIGEGVMKKMKEKDEQIQMMGKLNLALQERVKSLYVENQLWRDLAQTNEATANTLRTNLEQVLAHVTNEHLSAGGGAPAAAEDDAESCCGSCDHVNAREIEEEEQWPGAEHRRILTDAQDAGGCRMCKVCGERESWVLLLPCRHLCLCTQCGSTLHRSCPVCNSNMTATVHVNLSSS